MQYEKIELSNIFITSCYVMHHITFFVMRTLEMYSLSDIEMYRTQLLPIGTTLCNCRHMNLDMFFSLPEAQFFI